jgi:3-oxoacyl-[acyl-carrier protein] reductase
MMRPRVVVTGASRGIGRAIALRLAGKFHVLAAARSQADLEQLAREIADGGGECTPIRLDVRDGAAVQRALGDQDVEVLVNNAGVGTLKPLLELTPDEWQRMLDVNLSGVYHVTRAVLPGMVARQRGHVVNIGSIASRSAFVGGSCYAATKHALMALTECLMLEVRDSGVKVSVVNPGSVATDFSPRSDPGWMLSGEDVAEAVLHVLETPPGVLVHRVEVRALSPKRRRQP